MKYRHNQKMTITNGFYKTKKGRIKDFKTTKEGDIFYSLIVVIDDRETTIDVKEKDMKPSLF